MKILMGGAFVGRFLINLVLQGSLLDSSSTSSLVKSTEESRQEKIRDGTRVNSTLEICYFVETISNCNHHNQD